MKKYTIHTDEPFISRERIEKHKDFEKLLAKRLTMKNRSRRLKRVKIAAGSLMGILLLGLAYYSFISLSTPADSEPQKTSLEQSQREEGSKAVQEPRQILPQPQEPVKEKALPLQKKEPVKMPKTEPAPYSPKMEREMEPQVSAEKEALPVKQAEEEVSYQQARPREGMKQLYAYFNRELLYPEDELVNETEGTVILTFSIDKEGAAREIQVVQGVSEGIDREAIRLIQHMPQWEPARLYGEKVSSRANLPITFKITDRHE